MEDVKELCKRVLIINNGEIVYDGALADLTKTIADHKLLTVMFTDPIQKEQLLKYGTVESHSKTASVIKVGVKDVRSISAAIMAELPVDDITIGEPSVEDVIREIFAKK